MTDTHTPDEDVLERVFQDVREGRSLMTIGIEANRKGASMEYSPEVEAKIDAVEEACYEHYSTHRDAEGQFLEDLGQCAVYRAALEALIDTAEAALPCYRILADMTVEMAGRSEEQAIDCVQRLCPSCAARARIESRGVYGQRPTGVS